MKKFISKILVNRHKKNNVRIRRFHNFQSAKTAGIIFNASDNVVYAEAKSLLAFFGQNKIKTEGLGYADKQQIESFYKTYTGFNFFCQKDINFLGSPKSQIVKDFVGQPFDILIDLSFSPEVVYDTICSMSMASFKTGTVSERIKEYDLIIEMKESNSPGDFIKQLKHYLETINVNQNEQQ